MAVFVGPDEREVKTKEQTTGEFIPKSSVMYQPQTEESIVEHSKSIYSEIFEDADAFIDNEANVGNLNELKDRPDPRNVANKVPSNGAPSEGPQTDGPQPEGPPSDGPLSNNQDTAEDWDKEIQDTLAYNLVLETFKERSQNKVHFDNQLQNLLFSYPPASHAFTKTANYESAVYSSPAPPPCKVQLSCPSDTGQFDDADEDDCVESSVTCL